MVRQDFQIIKRSGELVTFDREKIRLAITKAFGCRDGELAPEALDALVASVTEELGTVFVDFVPNVENVQDVVEKKLMQHGYYDVAKAYILYRKDHEKIRQQKKLEDLQKLEKSELNVVKRDGSQQPFSERKLRLRLTQLSKGFEGIVDVDLLFNHCKDHMYDGIQTSEIDRSMMMTARSFTEYGAAYSYVAARFLLHQIYHGVIGTGSHNKNFAAEYRKAFIDGIKRGVRDGVLDERLLDFDLESVADAIDPRRDGLFAYLGIQTLADRYLLKTGAEESLFETPQAMWMRVAMGLSINETKPEERAVEFYSILSTLRYTPSTPTLFHAGTSHPQLSSCYLTTIEDDLHHIFKSVGDNAQLAKWSGGIGNDWTNLRATGAFIKGNRVKSNGIVPFLKIADDTTAAINRSGKRRGATCAYLETWHLDIEDFLELRKNTGDDRRRTHDMNTANWIPDLFMKRVMNGEEWTLFSPDEVSDLHHTYGRDFEERYVQYERLADKGQIKKFKRMKARDLWRKMLTMLFETGHPWMTFKDPCNIRSPQDHVGVVHSSNLCTEITLNTSSEETAVCNLGSVNLSNHITNGQLDLSKIEETVTTAMRMLDNVIDLNFYPTREARNSNLKHRPVGLGVMGFQDALYKMNIRFDSEECIALADESMEAIAYYAYLASSDLARERGTYDSYKGSKWDRGIFPQDTIALLEEERGIKLEVDRTSRLDWAAVRDSVAKHGMRNSNCLAIAPTATIANINGVFPSIEPIYKNIYVKANQSGDFTVVNNYLIEDLKKHNLFDVEMLGKLKYHDGSIQKITEIPQTLKEKYKEVFEIDSEWLLRAAAKRGKWIDQSQSLNVFFHGTSGKDLANLYMHAWSLGLKTTYYLRTLAASQVEKSTVDTISHGVTHKRESTVAQTPSQVEEKKPVAIAPSPSQIPTTRVEGPLCEACE